MVPSTLNLAKITKKVTIYSKDKSENTAKIGYVRRWIVSLFNAIDSKKSQPTGEKFEPSASDSEDKKRTEIGVSVPRALLFCYLTLANRNTSLLRTAVLGFVARDFLTFETEPCKNLRRNMNRLRRPF